MVFSGDKDSVYCSVWVSLILHFWGILHFSPRPPVDFHKLLSINEL